jgi:hypothetical protein
VAINQSPVGALDCGSRDCVASRHDSAPGAAVSTKTSGINERALLGSSRRVIDRIGRCAPVFSELLPAPGVERLYAAIGVDLHIRPELDPNRNSTGVSFGR